MSVRMCVVGKEAIFIDHNRLTSKYEVVFQDPNGISILGKYAKSEPAYKKAEKACATLRRGGLLHGV